MAFIEIPILSSNKQVNYTQLARIDIFVSGKEIKWRKKKKKKKLGNFLSLQHSNFRVVTDKFSASLKTKYIKSNVHFLPLKDHLI